MIRHSGLFAAFACFAVLLPSASASDVEVPVVERTYRWLEVTAQAAFAPRDGAGALVFQDQMWFLGGWNPRDKVHFPLICNNEVWSSVDGAAWTLRKPNTFLNKQFDPKSDWEGRHTAGYAVLDGRMWIIGGDANQRHYQNDVWSTADGEKWSLVTDSVPWGPRALHYTVAYGDQLWVIGGQTMPAFGGGEEKFYRDVWTSSDGKSWTEVKPVEPCWTTRGMIGGAAVFQDRVWMLGGGTYDTPTTPKRNFYSDVWSTDDGVRWKLHTKDAGWHPRQYHDVAVFDDQLWVLEGYDGKGNRNDVWRSADGATWHDVPGTPWAARHASSIYVYNDALWVVAGNNMTSDVWKLVRMK